jgi:hypothetical protein
VGGPEVVGDLAGVYFVGEPDALGVEDVQDGIPARGEVFVASGTGGNIATVCQIEEPVKPITVSTPNAAAARAVSAISATARCLTPSGT